jgi:hypothetical protein
MMSNISQEVPVEFAGKTIGVSINISAIREINAADSSFWCKFWLNILYEDETIKVFYENNPAYVFADSGFLDFDADEDPKPSKKLRPNPTLMNSVDVERAEEVVRVINVTRGLISWNIRFQGKFSVPMDVHEFPFDAQMLSVGLCFKETFTVKPHPTDLTMWYGRYTNVEFQPLEFDTTRDEKVPLVDMDISTIHYGTSGRVRPHVQGKIVVVRAAGHYRWNVITFVVCLLVLNLFVILMSPDDLGGRMGNNLALLLTFAAFKITLAGDVPKVGYLTQLDKYLLTSFILTSCLGFESMSVYFLSIHGVSRSLLRTVDTITGVAYVFLMCLAHYPLFDLRKERKRREEFSRDLKDHSVLNTWAIKNEDPESPMLSAAAS